MPNAILLRKVNGVLAALLSNGTVLEGTSPPSWTSLSSLSLALALLCVPILLVLGFIGAFLAPGPESTMALAPESLVGLGLMGTITHSVFDTAVLTRVVNSLTKEVNAWFLRTFFTMEQFSTDEYIDFDVEKIRPRITPLVAPHMPAKVVDKTGYDKMRFKPAYAKDLRIFEANGALKLAMGESLGGTMAPAARQAARIRYELNDQLTMLTRREEVMAAEFLRTGKITVSGEGYDTQLVDFGRHADLTTSLSGNDEWDVNHADSDPNTDLEAWSALMASKGGGAFTDVVMAPDAWQAYRARLIARDEARGILDFARSGSAQANLAPIGRGLNEATLVAVYNGINIWMYDDIYIDDNNAEQHMMPSGSLVGVNRNALEGTRAYGVIEDEESNFASQRFFSSSWFAKNPTKRMMMLQSAPLPIAYRPNASFCVNVL